METTLAQNADEQQSEILALESIYETGKFTTDRSNDGRLCGKITIEVPMSTKMTLTATVKGGKKKSYVRIQYELYRILSFFSFDDEEWENHREEFMKFKMKADAD